MRRHLRPHRVAFVYLESEILSSRRSVRPPESSVMGPQRKGGKRLKGMTGHKKCWTFKLGDQGRKGCVVFREDLKELSELQRGCGEGRAGRRQRGQRQERAWRV